MLRRVRIILKAMFLEVCILNIAVKKIARTFIVTHDVHRFLYILSAATQLRGKKILHFGVQLLIFKLHLICKL